MYEIILPRNVQKDIKKLDKSTINKIVLTLEDIVENPYNGSSLSGPYSSLFKWEVIHLGTSYRIVYEIFDDTIQVHVLKIGTRENFYKELKRRR